MIILNSSLLNIVEHVKKSSRVMNVTIFDGSFRNSEARIQKMMSPENQNKIEGVLFDAIDSFSAIRFNSGISQFTLVVQIHDENDLIEGSQTITNPNFFSDPCLNIGRYTRKIDQS